MKVNLAKDSIQINGKIIKKFIFISDSLFVNNTKIKLPLLFNSQKQKAILDFLLNKFQKISFLMRRLFFFRGAVSLFKSDGIIYHQGVNPKFHYPKKYIVKINRLKEYIKLIKWSNKIKLYNKLNHPNLITTIKKKIVYMFFKVIFNKERNSQLRRKVILLGYKVLELKIVIFWKISLGSFKKGDLKLLNKIF